MLEQCKTTSLDCFRGTPDLVCIPTLGTTQFIVFGVERVNFHYRSIGQFSSTRRAAQEGIGKQRHFFLGMGQGVSPAVLQWWLACGGEMHLRGSKLCPTDSGLAIVGHWDSAHHLVHRLFISK